MKLVAKCAIYAGGERIAPGTSFEIADSDGEVLVARGFAKLAPADPATSPEPAPPPAVVPEPAPPAKPKIKKPNVT